MIYVDQKAEGKLLQNEPPNPKKELVLMSCAPLSGANSVLKHADIQPRSSSLRAIGYMSI